MTSYSDLNHEDLGSKKIADERGGRLKRRVNFLLDEFGNFSKTPDFANKLTVGGGRGIRFNLLLQSFAQLEEISKKLGNYTVSTYSLSASSKANSTSSSQSINLTGRALLDPNDIRLISRQYSLVISRENPAIMYAPDISQMYFSENP